MDTHSLSGAARSLGTSVPRLRRALRDLEIIPTRQGREQRLTASQYAALRRRLGFAPQVVGLTREEMFVLAALNRHPLGLRSVRAIARSASVSPTTASHAVTHLRSLGLVSTRTERVVEGRARDIAVTRIALLEPGWIEIAPAVRKVVLPQRHERRTPAKAIPPRLWHHFWNAEPSKLRLPADSDYVAARLLRSDDPQALSWAASHLDEASIGKVARLRGVDDKRRSLILHLAHD